MAGQREDQRRQPDRTKPVRRAERPIGWPAVVSNTDGRRRSRSRGARDPTGARRGAVGRRARASARVPGRRSGGHPIAGRGDPRAPPGRGGSSGAPRPIRTPAVCACASRRAAAGTPRTGRCRARGDEQSRAQAGAGVSGAAARRSARSRDATTPRTPGARARDRREPCPTRQPARLLRLQGGVRHRASPLRFDVHRLRLAQLGEARPDRGSRRTRGPRDGRAGQDRLRDRRHAVARRRAGDRDDAIPGRRRGALRPGARLRGVGRAAVPARARPAQHSVRRRLLHGAARAGVATRLPGAQCLSDGAPSPRLL